MCGVDSISDLQDEPHGLRRCEGPAQRRAVDVLQHEIARTQVVNLTDVRMVQRRNRARLLLESTDAVRVRGQFLRQHLDGDLPIKAFVTCAIHLAHPAPAEERDDFVRAEARTRLQGHLNISSRLYWQFQNILAKGQSAASRESDDQAGGKLDLPDDVCVDADHAEAGRTRNQIGIGIHEGRKHLAAEAHAETIGREQLDPGAAAEREADLAVPFPAYRVNPAVPLRKGRTRPGLSSWSPPACQ